jgi:hypothetical protein
MIKNMLVKCRKPNENSEHFNSQVSNLDSYVTQIL